MTTMKVRPIRDDLAFGARVGGVTLDSLGDAGLRAEINEAFEKYGLLIFEDVEPTPQMQVDAQQGDRPAQGPPEQGSPAPAGTTCSA